MYKDHKLSFLFQSCDCKIEVVCLFSQLATIASVFGFLSDILDLLLLNIIILKYFTYFDTFSKKSHAQNEDHYGDPASCLLLSTKSCFVISVYSSSLLCWRTKQPAICIRGIISSYCCPSRRLFLCPDTLYLYGRFTQ